MLKKGMVLTGLLLGLALLFTPIQAMMCHGDGGHGDMGDMKHEEKKAGVEAYQVTMYICPMHPEVRQDISGNCSKCGMKLEKKQITKYRAKNDNKKDMTCDVVKSTETNALKGVDIQKKGSKKSAIYACPMHSEVTSDKPGNCPKCGMKLKKIK